VPDINDKLLRVARREKKMLAIPDVDDHGKYKITCLYTEK
jgi:hypothetical protein